MGIINKQSPQFMKAFHSPSKDTINFLLCPQRCSNKCLTPDDQNNNECATRGKIRSKDYRLLLLVATLIFLCDQLSLCEIKDTRTNMFRIVFTTDYWLEEPRSVLVCFFFLEESAERRGMGRDAELSRAAAAALALPNLHLNNKHI